MDSLFGFSLRLFICFVIAKLCLRAIGADSLIYLIGLTILLLGNAYGFEFLIYRERFWQPQEEQDRQPAAAPETEEITPNLSSPEA